MNIRPKSWEEFQHYKDRDPTWIKLHKKLLDNYEFQSLPVTSRALAPMLWLIASEDKTGLINAEERKLAFRLRTTPAEIRDGLKPLIEAGFFISETTAITPIAVPEPPDSPEKQVRDKEEEKEVLPAGTGNRDSYPPKFEEFWKGYPTDRNMSKKEAFKVWKKLSPEKQEQALKALPGYRAYCAENKKWYRVKYADGFLKEERFEGYITAAANEPTPEEIAAAKDKADRIMKRGAYDPMREILQ